MKKTIFIRIALSVLSAMILVGAGLTTHLLVNRNSGNVIEVEVQNGETQSVEFENLCLIPGEECLYVIELSSDIADEYEISLKFEETQEDALKNFAYAKIEANGETVCDKLLADLFGGEEILLYCDLKDGGREITITYYIPENVGNEAQNSGAVFDLSITASNE